jgi:hypothetical protein
MQPMPERHHDPRFAERHAITILELMDLLGIPPVSKDPVAHAAFRRTPVGQTVDRIHYWQEQGEHDYSEWEMAKAWRLVQELKRIDRHDRALADDFAADLRRRSTYDQYYGIRCEINVAATLVERGVAFEKGESPDFTVTHAGQWCGIECSSAHLTNPSTPVPLQKCKFKVGSVINTKAKKPYKGLHVALAIDITNILMHSDARSLFSLEVVPFAAAELERAGYGSAILFMYIRDMDTWVYAPMYSRIDHPRIDPLLLRCLDQGFPGMLGVIRDYTVPPTP